MVRATGSYPVGHKFESHRRYQRQNDAETRFSIRPVGQAVKTPPFHGGNMGSSPVRVTSKKDRINSCLFCCMFPVRLGANPRFGKCKAFSLPRGSHLWETASPRTGHFCCIFPARIDLNPSGSREAIYRRRSPRIPFGVSETSIPITYFNAAMRMHVAATF